MVNSDDFDPADARIERCLGDLARKKDLMSRWHRPQPSQRGAIAASAAVLVVLAAAAAFVFAPKGGAVPEPLIWNEVAVRGTDGLDAAADLVRLGRYGEAERIVDRTLADTAVDLTLPAERLEYERLVVDDRTYRAKWLKINILARNGQSDKARVALEDFAMLPGEYRTAARHMLEKMP